MLPAMTVMTGLSCEGHWDASRVWAGSGVAAGGSDAGGDLHGGFATCSCALAFGKCAGQLGKGHGSGMV